MQHRTANKKRVEQNNLIKNESVVSFTFFHDDENIGGSKPATNVQSSGDTVVNQLEPDKKNQPRDSSNSSTKGVITKSYHDAEA